MKILFKFFFRFFDTLFRLGLQFSVLHFIYTFVERKLFD